MIKIIIIDDESRARIAIENIILSNLKDVEIVDRAEDVKSGLNSILKHKPNIVLLDINLPDGTGFDILRQIPKIDFKLIFITAHEEYAVKAIKFSALDYIVKPIDVSELIAAVERARNEVIDESNNLKIEAFLTNFENIKNEVKKIVLKTSDSIHLVNIQNIIRCEADNNYTHFYLNDNKKILVSNTLKEYEELLGQYNFFRVHQSHLINLNYIAKFDKKDGGSLVMTDKSQIPVSARKRHLLLEFFDRL